jgi:16S rRNA (cytosine1402-N4)-methyltransferase
VSSPHFSVLYHETIQAVNPRSGGRYIDCTLGAGGHASGLLEASAPGGLVLGLDVDPEALAIARERLASFGSRFISMHASYTTLRQAMAECGWDDADGIILDLGASSMQFDQAHRGFSFLYEGSLDMRFNPEQTLTAAQIVNEFEEGELADLIFEFGEEKQSRKIAAAIVRNRPIKTTTELAKVVSDAVRSPKGKPQRIHPATRTFQSLRIAVNQELMNVRDVLPEALKALKPGGRLAVISFHSLEDRIVKHYLKEAARDCVCPPEQIMCTCDHRAELKIITKKPIIPTEEETELNARSRSAKLRIAEKL